MRAAGVLVGLLLTALAAHAHSGGSSSATFVAPRGVGELADESYEVRWSDADMRFGASVVTFDLRYTSLMPPTTALGVVPQGVVGGYVAVAIDEADLENRVRWDTRGVPAGTYFVWAVPSEDPPDMPLTLVTFSRGVVTVAHPGDPLHPAVILPEPSTPLARAQGAWDVAYEAFDPTGTASVTLEASPARDGQRFVRIADGLPAQGRGTARWDLVGVAPGPWMLRATIRDARGLSFTAYARYFVEVDVEPESDAGVSIQDAAALPALDARAPHQDASPGPGADAGADAALRPDGAPQAPSAAPGCSCAAAPAGGWLACAAAIVLGALRLRARASRARSLSTRS